MKHKHGNVIEFYNTLGCSIKVEYFISGALNVKIKTNIFLIFHK